MRAVEVVDAEPAAKAAGLVAVLPCGTRIEGLSVADVAELTRRLR